MLISDRPIALLSGNGLFPSSTIYISEYYYIYDCKNINYIVTNDNYTRTLDTSDSVVVLTENIFREFSFVDLFRSRPPLNISPVTLNAR